MLRAKRDFFFRCFCVSFLIKKNLYLHRSGTIMFKNCNDRTRNFQQVKYLDVPIIQYALYIVATQEDGKDTAHSPLVCSIGNQ